MFKKKAKTLYSLMQEVEVILLIIFLYSQMIMKLIDFTLVLQNIIMEHSKNICPMQQVYDLNNKQYHSNFENVAHQTLMRVGSNLPKQLLDSYSSQTKMCSKCQKIR